MTDTELQAAISASLAPVAPEADLAALDPEAPLRETLDLDSYDFLQFLIALSQKLGIEVPEAEYAKLATMNGVLSYLRGACSRP